MPPPPLRRAYRKRRFLEMLGRKRGEEKTAKKGEREKPHEPGGRRREKEIPPFLPNGHRVDKNVSSTLFLARRKKKTSRPNICRWFLPVSSSRSTAPHTLYCTVLYHSSGRTSGGSSTPSSHESSPLDMGKRRRRRKQGCAKAEKMGTFRIFTHPPTHSERERERERQREANSSRPPFQFILLVISSSSFFSPPRNPPFLSLPSSFSSSLIFHHATKNGGQLSSSSSSCSSFFLSPVNKRQRRGRKVDWRPRRLSRKERRKGVCETCSTFSYHLSLSPFFTRRC